MSQVGQSLSRFLQHEATKNISTTPGWDASPLHCYCNFAYLTNSQLQWNAVDTDTSRPRKCGCILRGSFLQGRGSGPLILGEEKKSQKIKKLEGQTLSNLP